MFRIFLVGFFFSTLFTDAEITRAQCDDEMGVFDCAELLGGDTVIYLSDFTARGKKKKNSNDVRFNWEIYLNKNTNYRFALCCKTGISDKILLIYNDDCTEEQPCASTFTDNTDRQYFDYLCPKEGPYVVCIKFKNPNSTERLCAIGLLGYIGKKH